MGLRLVLVLDLAFEIFTWILIARFLLSWIPRVDYHHPVVRFIYRATDFVVRPFRGIIPPVGSIDFSPIIMFLVLRLGYSLVRRILVIFVLQWSLGG
ncbi:MAG TPA: YggT family protein [Firmicutes bacterium]|jgi:YggT family protein|nr:YggT family protein [Bacillota bacterium]